MDEALLQAILAADSSQMYTYAYDLETSLLGVELFPVEHFELLMKLLCQTAFLEAEGSWHFLKLLESNWGILSDYQKEQLLPALEAVYGCFTDWMSWFVISEILGSYYANEQALQSLQRLKNLPQEGPRSFVPHGLEHIVKDCKDQRVAKMAFVELLQMKADPSEDVRDEAEISLERLANIRM
jgi:hypothetical protein